MGVGSASAAKKVLARAGLKLDQMDVIDPNGAIASQALAGLRGLGLPNEATHVNHSGGANALGRPPGSRAPGS
jgi:acetyl-CoA acetyltransferase